MARPVSCFTASVHLIGFGSVALKFKIKFKPDQLNDETDNSGPKICICGL